MEFERGSSKALPIEYQLLLLIFKTNNLGKSTILRCGHDLHDARFPARKKRKRLHLTEFGTLIQFFWGSPQLVVAVNLGIPKKM
jgi:hypothetical protein